MHCLEHRIKYGNPEVENNTQQSFPATRPYCSIEFIELFWLWVSLVTYNIGVFILNFLAGYFFLLSYLMLFCIACCTFWETKIFLIKLANRLLHNSIHQLVKYFWVFVITKSIFYFMEFFFSRKLWFLWSPCLMIITEVISLDNSDKTTSRITSICSTIWEKIDDTSSFIALTTTSAFLISDETLHQQFLPQSTFFVLFPQTFFLANLISLGSWIF